MARLPTKNSSPQDLKRVSFSEDVTLCDSSSVSLATTDECVAVPYLILDTTTRPPQPLTVLSEKFASSVRSPRAPPSLFFLIAMADESRALGSVLVIGGCGYLGSRLIRQLIDNKDATFISVIDIKTDKHPHPNVTYHELDICSWVEVSSTFHQIRPHTVFHTASPFAFGFDLKFYEKVNVGGTKNLLRAAEAVRTVKAFVYSSSASVVHDGTSDLIMATEDTPIVLLPAQRSVYSHSKALGESVVLEANRQAGDMLTCSIRLSGMFGEDDASSTKPMIDAAASGKYRYQMGNGQNLFDRTYVGNVVQAHVLAAHALTSAPRPLLSSSTAIPADERVDGEALLITNDEPMRFWDFARALGAAAGYPTAPQSVRVIPKWMGLIIVALMEWAIWIASLGQRDSSAISTGIRYSMMNRTYNIEKAKKRLGYRPTVNMAEGIRRAGESFMKDKKRA